MPENHSPGPEHDDEHRHIQVGERSAPTSDPYEVYRADVASASYPTTLLADTHLGGRGNSPVRSALMLQAQQTYGNRAVQRFLQRMPVQRTGYPDFASTITPPGTNPGAGVPYVPTAPSNPATPGAPTTPEAKPGVTITRQGGDGATFVSSDTITLTAQVTGGPPATPGKGRRPPFGPLGVTADPAPAADGQSGNEPASLYDALMPAAAGETASSQGGVNWTVSSNSPDSGTGNPHTATNTTTFSFKPNPTNRQTSGSRSANPPIKYRVEAEVGGATAYFDLEQDETDTIRQEYVDFGASTIPGRSEIVSPAVAGFNVGNYSLIIDNGMPAALSATTAAFASLTQKAAHPAPKGGSGERAAPGGGDEGTPAPEPVPAVSVSSGYRNPRRNVAAGSHFPVTSRHVWGSALDLTVAGANATLWERLRQAGRDAGYTSICENGPTEVAPTDPGVDHVHIQW